MILCLHVICHHMLMYSVGPVAWDVYQHVQFIMLILCMHVICHHMVMCSVNFSMGCVWPMLFLTMECILHCILGLYMYSTNMAEWGEGESWMG